MNEIQKLSYREELRELRARYWRFVDTKQWRAFGDLFTPDAVFEEHALGITWTGRAKITKSVSEAMEDVISVHHGHQSEIAIVDDDHANGIWAMEDYLIYPPSEKQRSTLRGSGHYVDRYVRVDGNWLFERVDLYRLRIETTKNFASSLPDALRRP